MLFNIPNILTIARIALIIPLVMLFFLEAAGDPLGGARATWMIFGLYVFAALTDYLDGVIARKFDQKTAFGTFLDPISDKILVSALFILFLAFDRLSGVWIIPVMLIFTREFLVSGIREFLGPHNIQMPVTKLAKWKTATQMMAIGFIIAAPLSSQADLAGKQLLILATALTLITGWGYFKSALEAIRKMD